MGAGYAKKLTANWKSTAVCRTLTSFDSNLVSITFLTYSNSGEQRESFGFGGISKFDLHNYFLYNVYSNVNWKFGMVSTGYSTWKYDGDVTEDIYYLDTTATDNYFRVDKIDPVSKRIEGSFSVTFKVEEPRSNPANPPTVKFSAGRYWAIIQE